MGQKSSEELLNLAIEAVQTEINTLKDLSDHLDQTIVKVSRLVFESTGRLVVSGIGKSAIIAQKIVATLNSTGTPSLYMHAADAIHGDLGMIAQNDMVLLISKSGETSEIKALIPLIKRLGNKIISMTSNPKSFLAKNSAYHLFTPVKKEAEPNNLAPTASTTAQMAMGDALAVCLLALRGFSTDRFATLHPGGSLGKQLYLTAGEIASKNYAPQVVKDASIRDAILAISKGLLGAAAVVENDHILGIITDGDLRRMMNEYEDTKNLKVSDIMSKGGYHVHPETLAVEALQLMQEKSINQLLIKGQDGSYVGMINLHDLMKEGIV